MTQGGEDAAREIEQGIFCVAHDVLDVVPEDPEVQHIADEVHPAAVEKHAREQSGVGGNGHDRVRKVGLPEQEGGDRSVLEGEGVGRSGREADLIEKDKDAGRNGRDCDYRRQFGRVIVV